GGGRRQQPGAGVADAEHEAVDDDERDGRPCRSTAEREEERHERSPGEPAGAVPAERDEAEQAGPHGAAETGERDHASRGARMKTARCPAWVALALVVVLAIFGTCLVNAVAWIGR